MEQTLLKWPVERSENVPSNDSAMTAENKLEQIGHLNGEKRRKGTLSVLCGHVKPCRAFVRDKNRCFIVREGASEPCESTMSTRAVTRMKPLNCSTMTITPFLPLLASCVTCGLGGVLPTPCRPMPMICCIS